MKNEPFNHALNFVRDLSFSNEKWPAFLKKGIFFHFFLISIFFYSTDGNCSANSSISEFNTANEISDRVLMPMVDNLTQITSHATIQDAINSANPGDVLQLNAGSYSENVVITKSLTLQGATSDKTLYVIDGTGLPSPGSGIVINVNVTNVTIRNLTVQDFTGSSGNTHAGIYGVGGNDNLTVTNVAMLNNPTASGFYANGPVDNVSITNCLVQNNGGSARGVVIWNGFKTNINISGNTVINNSCCGIELQDGTASAVTISNNTLDIGTGDNGLGINGLNATIGSNLISNNMISGGGRFGIEIKNPAGGVTVSGNTVNMVSANADLRDRAGIAILRRSVLAGNVDVPNGVTISGNNVSGWTQSSSSEGFGIVVEGINHSVTGNNVSACDVGILQQQNPSNYPADADQSNVADLYFGRGNSPMTCNNVITGNIVSAFTDNYRNIGVGTGLVTNTNTSEVFCSIQTAINDAQTLAGHTLSLVATTYVEDVNINKGVTVQGAGYNSTTISGPIGGQGSTVLVGSTGVVVDGVTITREGNNTTDWNNPNINNGGGVAIQGLTVSAEIRNCKITGNRTGIDVNNSTGNNIHNNIITFNRTGLLFRNQTDNTQLIENEISDNWTVGVLFLDASGGSNVPVQSALNSNFNDNTIFGNWYGQVVDRQAGGSLPTPGTTNMKNFECNWFGNTLPVVSTANSTEPGYAGQIPVAYGGAAVPPGGQPDILGPGSANIDFQAYLVDGTDDDMVTTGFQPVAGSCSGCLSGNSVYNTNTTLYYCTIQDAIDDPLTQTGDVITVSAGTYAEHVIINKSVELRGPNFGVNGNAVRGPEALIVPEVNLMPGDPWTEVVYIAANNVTFDGFRVSGDNPGISGYAYAGLNLEKGQCVYSEGSNVTFRNNVIDNATTMGFFAGGGLASPHYKDIIVTQNKFEQIHDLTQIGYGYGMYIQGTTGAITNNTITNVRSGIQIQPYQVQQNVIAPVVSGNTFNVWKTGIYYNYAENNATAWNISGNTINAVAPPANPTGPVRWQGIAAETIRASSNGGVVTNNIINGNSITDPMNWWAVNGLQYAGNASTSTAMQFTNNTVSGVKTGFVHDAAADIVLTGNNLSATEQVISIQRTFNSAGVDQGYGGTNNINATGGNVYNGVNSTGASDAQLFAIEDLISHKIDNQIYGFVTVKANHIHVTDIATPSAVNNDYTRLRNAVDLLSNGKQVNLFGSFDWVEANAAAAWALGNDNTVSTGDDYSLIMPANINNVTFTAPGGLGSASIDGPGDLAGVNLEGVFYFDGGDNQGWTISNLTFNQFDLPIGMFFGAGGTDAFSNTTINNNVFNMATDLNATVAPADVNQNIGLHYAFGTNQTISNNVFNIAGDGISNGANFSSSIGMQSNTSGGAVYDGLNITGNVINVLNAQSANPQVIIGIWDNGHAHNSNINISGNQFNNLAPGNDPALNLQRGFRVTSHSGPGSTVTYANNIVNGANLGMQWIAGSNFSAQNPVVVSGNTLTGNYIAALVQSNGKAQFTANVFDGGVDNNRDIQVVAGSVITSGGTNQFAGDSYFIENLGATSINVSSDTYDESNYFRITDKMYGALDNLSSGVIRINGANLYVSAPGTGLSDETIARGNTAAAMTGDKLNIESGTYPEPIDATGKDLTVVPGSSPGCVGVTGMILNSGDALEIEIEGNTACSLFDQVQVTGTVTLGGANLIVNVGMYTPPVGQQFLIIDNDGMDLVSGVFAQGTFVNSGPYIFEINYTGGDGNDVVLTRCSSNVTNTTTLETFCTLQSAIDDVNTLNGHTLVISAGTFNENITISKALTLLGANQGVNGCSPSRVAETTIDGGSGTAITIASNGVTLNGLEIVGSTAVAASTYTNLTIINNKIEADAIGVNVAGISTSPGNTLTVENNCIDLTTQTAAGPTPTMGVLLAGASGSIGVTLNNNTVTDGFYGYVVYGNATIAPGVISNGTITGVLQGIAVVNTLGGPLAPSNVTITGMHMSGFAGDHPTLPAYNFHAGVYTFTAGTTVPLTGLVLSISNDTIIGTGSISASGAAVYLGDFSTGGISVQTVNIAQCVITSNHNRGVDSRGYVTTSIDACTFTSNGDAPWGIGGNEGFTILAQRGANVTASNNFITHPASSTHNVYALMTGNIPGANTIEAHDNSILMNGNASGFGANNSGGNTINADCNWWGGITNIASLMVGAVTYEFFLTNGTDDMPGTPGFQPVANSCNGCAAGYAIINTTTLVNYCDLQTALDASIANLHEIHIVAGNVNAASVNIALGKKLVVNTGTSLTNIGTVTNIGTLKLDGGTFVNNGIYKGTGFFDGNLVNTIMGTVQPGN